MRFRTSLHKVLFCTSGAVAIEFAMVGLLVISLLLGVFEFGHALFLRNQLAFAADVGVRHVLLNPPKVDSDLDQIEAVIRKSIAFDHSYLEVDLTLPAADGIMPIILRYPLTLLVPDLIQSNVILSVNRRIVLSDR